MIRTHKIKLYPTSKQELLLRQSCGVSRFAYNWALDQWRQKHQNGEKTSANALIKELTAIKREQFPWMMNVSKTCPQYAIHHLEAAFKNFFSKQARYPRFKKKGTKDSFVAVENQQAFNQKNFRLHIPRVGKVKCAENLRFSGKVNHVVVRRVADMWFALINVDIPVDALALRENQASVGVDMGIKTMLVLSDGRTFENPKALRSNLKSLKRLNRALSRKQKGSQNHRKAKNRIAKKHYRISCIRHNAIHLATKTIVNDFDRIVIEDLAVAGMIKNRKVAQALADVSFGEIARQLTYKAEALGKQVIKADRFFPSSKICSNCRYKKDVLKLSERTFNCENCGHSIDRDLNAAINLANYSPTSKSEGRKACGEGSSLILSDSPSMKQELKLNSKQIKT